MRIGSLLKGAVEDTQGGDPGTAALSLAAKPQRGLPEMRGSDSIIFGWQRITARLDVMSHP